MAHYAAASPLSVSEVVPVDSLFRLQLVTNQIRMVMDASILSGRIRNLPAQPSKVVKVVLCCTKSGELRSGMDRLHTQPETLRFALKPFSHDAEKNSRLKKMSQV